MRTGTAEQLHWLDQTTINGDLETGLLLMERASRGLTDVALQYLEDEAEEGELPWAAVFCGTGNNGGDGVACARMLHEAGVKVRAFLVGKREKMTPDSKANEQRLNACGGQAVVIAGKAVALAGHAVDGEAVRTQRADGLVHRRTRHAERLREPAARKPFAARLLERREHLVLHCHEYVHPSQTDFLSHLL